MRRCSRCRLDETATEFGAHKHYCKKCYREYSAEYRAKKPESGRKAALAWYYRNREQSVAAVAAWKRANPEKAKEQYRNWVSSGGRAAWNEKNRDKRNTQNNLLRRKLQETDPGRIRAWRRAFHKKHRDRINAKRNAERAANPEPSRKKDRLRYKKHREKRVSASMAVRAKRAGAAGSHTVAEWKALLRHHNRKCVYCGSTLTRYTVSRDHRLPLVRGGTNDIKNIVPACRRCNSRKHIQTYEEYLLTISVSSPRAR